MRLIEADAISPGCLHYFRRLGDMRIISARLDLTLKQWRPDFGLRRVVLWRMLAIGFRTSLFRENRTLVAKMQ